MAGTSGDDRVRHFRFCGCDSCNGFKISCGKFIRCGRRIRCDRRIVLPVVLPVACGVACGVACK